MILALAVGLAGSVGAVARYLVDGAVQDRTSGWFPFGTFVVNVTGSLIIGLVAGLVTNHVGGSAAKAIAGAGFCGGLTTWSTVSWETARLAEEGSTGVAAVFTVTNLAACLLVAGVAFLIG